MGTSSHNAGQKGNTPLVPSWLDQIDVENQQNTEKDPVPVGEPNRFTQPRGEFTRYINSAGRDTGMARKSIANYAVSYTHLKTHSRSGEVYRPMYFD